MAEAMCASPPLVNGLYLLRGERVRLQRYRQHWLLYYLDRSPLPAFARTSDLQQLARLGILRAVDEDSTQ
jgi:hypothetical protein